MGAAALVAALATGATPAHAATERFTDGSFYYGNQVPYGSAKPLTRVSMDNGVELGFGMHNLDCAWAQNVDQTLPYPSAFTVKYSEDYWRAYGVTPPKYYNDYPGGPSCTNEGIGRTHHNYNGTSIRRGINFKSGLDPSKQWTSYGDQEW